MTDEIAHYEDIAYPGRAFAQSHPDRMATLATLFGLDPAPPDRCRVLELGCSDGGNLLPMALGLPQSTFVGIDLSAAAIDVARRRAAALGLQNVCFEACGLEDYAVAAGSFDYVVAHGVFSWVPEPVREALLALCARALTAHGVAYVSYNALPGARVPRTLHELLTLHLHGVEDPAQRIAGARRLLRLLSGDNEGATVLGSEAASLLGQSDALLYHDALSPTNRAFFFEEFVARAAEHGLQYLAEAQFLEMQTGMLPEDLREELFGVGCDVLRAEQLLDYLKVRRFRQTLLCGAALQIDRDVSIERIGRLSVSSPASATVQDAVHPARVTFEAPGGSRLTTDHELVVAALARIIHAWPAAERVSDLVSAADQEDARAVLCETLMRCYAGNVVQFHVHPARLVSAAGEHPRASPLARLQAAERGPVATLLHGTIRVDDEFDRLVLGLLDGTRDRLALHAELRAVTDIDGDELAERIEISLRQLAHAALLLA